MIPDSMQSERGADAAIQQTDKNASAPTVRRRFYYSGHLHADVPAYAEAVCFDRVGFTYPHAQSPALKSVSFCIHQAERVALLGPNGAGKSTLLKLMAGLLRCADPERIQVFGSSIDTCHPHTAYLAQRNEVDWRFPVTVRDVIMQGRYAHIGWFRRPSPHDNARVDESLHAVELTDLQSQRIGDLSGGQQQRAFLARALAQNARLLLLDEPFGGLDAPAQKTVMLLLNKLQTQGKTIVVSTHDLGSVMTGDVAERVLLLNREIAADGAPVDVTTPEVLARAYG